MVCGVIFSHIETKLFRNLLCIDNQSIGLLFESFDFCHTPGTLKKCLYNVDLVGNIFDLIANNLNMLIKLYARVQNISAISVAQNLFITKWSKPKSSFNSFI